MRRWLKTNSWIEELKTNVYLYRRTQCPDVLLMNIFLLLNKCTLCDESLFFEVGPSWSWLYGSWIYNCLCNPRLSPLTLWVRIPLRRGVLDTTLCDKVCQWPVTSRWFSPISSTNYTNHHDITEILLRVALNTINLNLFDILIIHRTRSTSFVKENK